MPDFIPSPFPWALAANSTLTIILSFLGFVIGIRAGKNNRDRAYLREIYQKLFNHLRVLKESIENGTPKQWESYRNKDHKEVPLIHGLEQDGTLNALPDRIGKQLIDVEKSTLFNNWHWRELISGKIAGEIRYTFLNCVDGGTIYLQGVAYREIRLSKIMMMGDHEFESFFAKLENDQVGFGLNLEMLENRSDIIYAYRSTLNSGTLSALANKIRSESLSTSEAVALVDKNRQQIQELEKLIKVISKRIKEPHPFWSSIKQALRDPFG